MSAMSGEVMARDMQRMFDCENGDEQIDDSTKKDHINITPATAFNEVLSN